MKTFSVGSRGPEVMEIQALLDKLGYKPGPIDGIYGSQTAAAVRRFQSTFGLPSTGSIGVSTYRIIRQFLLGYDLYVVQPGDTLYLIAQKYGTTLQSIITANPGVNPNNLQVGTQIIIPYSIDVVSTNIEYTYDIMQRDIRGLKARYPFIQVGSAGESVLGKELYYIKLGNGPNQVFYNGSHHAIEWITSVLLMKFIENFSKAYASGEKLQGYDVADIWKKSTIYIMPMVNPDGVDLVLEGLKEDNPYYARLIQWNNGRTDFSNWSANIRGVDLNHNYDASWEKSKAAEESYGVYGPGPTRYSGIAPESEPESSAVADFTRAHNFSLVLAYHSQGQVIYWDYQNLASERAKEIGQLFSRLSGYELEEAYGITSYAGYKDWFIEKYGRPGYTIEVGLGKNPLPISQFDQIYENNIEILLTAPLL